MGLQPIQTLVASAARTASGNSGLLVAGVAGATGVTLIVPKSVDGPLAPNILGVLLYLDITAFSGTGPTIQLQLLANDQAGNLAAVTPAIPSTAFAAAVSANTILVEVGYPVNSFGTFPATLSNELPIPFAVGWIIAGTTPSITFSVGAQLITAG